MNLRSVLRLHQRLRRALHAHFLRGRRAQLQQGIDTLDACIRDDQAMVAHMRRELRVIDARLADAGHAAPTAAGAH